MRMRNLWALVLVLCCGLLPLGAGAQTISQPVDSSFSSGNPDAGQSFTAPVTGFVTKIAIRPRYDYSGTLYLYNGGTGSGSFGAVGSPAYTQTGVSLAATTTNSTFREITLTTPFAVMAGSAYTFILAGSPSPFFTFSDPYAGGSQVFAYGAPNSSADLAFQVWITASQTLSFTSTAPSGATVGGAPYTVTATANSGLLVALSIDPASTSVCALNGNTVTFIGVGTCIINADQKGDDTYLPATRVQQSFNIGPGAQTLTFTSTPPSGATVGGAPYTVTATATSGLPVTLAIDPTSTSVCTLTGSTVTFIGVGTCTINADQPGNPNYLSATRVQQSITVGAPMAVPTLSPWTLLTLAGLLGLLATGWRRASRKV